MKKLDVRLLDKNIADLREKLRQQQPLRDAAAGARKAAAVADFGAFCRTYFPHHLELDPSPFHTWLCAEAGAWGPGARELVAAPRGHAKSMYLAVLYPLWRAAKQDVHFIVILQDATAQAEQSVEIVKAELEENKLLAADFPELCGPGPKWGAGYLTTRNSVRIEAYGAGKRIRGITHHGHRPDLVIADDLENDERVQSKKQRDKLFHWFTSAVLFLGPPQGTATYIYIGTKLHADAVLCRVEKRPDFQSHTFQALQRLPDRLDLWDQWEHIYRLDDKAAQTFYQQHQEAMERGAEALWPAAWSVYELMVARALDRRAFELELQNNPRDASQIVFERERFHYYTDPPADLRCSVGACDPALGKSMGDYTALVILGADAQGICYVLDADITRRDPLKTIARIIDLQRRYRCHRWVLETVAFQAVLKDLLVAESTAERVAVPVAGITPQYAKEIRIQSLEPHVHNGVIRFHASQTMLLDQLADWPQAPHDDGPDALDMAFTQIHGLSAMEFKSLPKTGLGAGLGLGASLKKFFAHKRGF